MRRAIGASLLAATLLTGCASQAGARPDPTPLIVYVTPVPTTVAMRPDPTPIIVYVTPAPTATPTPRPTPKSTPRPARPTPTPAPTPATQCVIILSKGSHVITLWLQDANTSALCGAVAAPFYTYAGTSGNQLSFSTVVPSVAPVCRFAASNFGKFEVFGGTDAQMFCTQFGGE